ncbi:membrane hypothetical protein [Mesorhizobium plurifarium]|uniref:ABC transmembrane type-1 domain-containing protein n=1 Tax=Mesorhizobium plurifarium TaxID=69974 RepID=A0A090DZH5_MESPL|nr:membrane hypothetical protein [Mesorhizobium plurifarium]
MTEAVIVGARAKPKRRRRRFTAGIAGQYLALVLTVALTVFPLVWLFLTSIRSSADIFSVPVHIIPETATLTQYVSVFAQYDTMGYVWNTVIVSVATVVLVHLLAIPCAYALSRFRMPGAMLIFGLLLIMRMIGHRACHPALCRVCRHGSARHGLGADSQPYGGQTARRHLAASGLHSGRAERDRRGRPVGRRRHRAHAGPDRGAADCARHRRQRRHHLPLHLERPLARANADLEQGRADAAGRAHQFRLAVRHRLGRHVGRRRAHGHPDLGVRLVCPGAAGQRPDHRRGSRLSSGHRPQGARRLRRGRLSDDR